MLTVEQNSLVLFCVQSVNKRLYDVMNIINHWLDVDAKDVQGPEPSQDVDGAILKNV